MHEYHGERRHDAKIVEQNPEQVQKLNPNFQLNIVEETSLPKEVLLLDMELNSFLDGKDIEENSLYH